MSNERSPREVCSMTMGMRGLMSRRLLATGGPQFRLCLRSFLFRCPDRLARLLPLERDALDLGRDPVEGGGKAEALALGLVGAARAQLLDHAVGVLEAFAD